MRRRLRWYRDRAHVELVNVVDRNRIVLIGERAIGGSGSDGDRARGSIAFAVDGTGDGDHAGSRIDGEASAIVIEQAVGDGVVR